MGAGAVLAAQGIAGGLTGGIGSAMQGADDRRALKEYINQQKMLQQQIQARKTAGEATTKGEYAPLLSGMERDVQDYYSALRNADYSKYDVSAPEDYQGQDLGELTQELMNPQTETMVQAASDKVQGAAANAGGLFSGVTAKNIANATAGVQAEQYEKARNAAQQQQAMDYQQYTDKFKNILAATQANRENYSSNLGAKGTLNQAQTGAFGAQQQTLGDIRNTANQNMLQSQQAQADAAAKKAGIGSTWSNFAKGALGGAGSALGGSSAWGGLAGGGETK